ncbi:MAG: universal stress protein [Cyanobacteria bacterium SZAS LIN-3]|nr:universal stress protein [Cyanobacteria bacterium SZAS LIN-3]
MLYLAVRESQGTEVVAARILIPVDNQECSEAAIHSVLARAWEPDTEFLLCKVVEDFGNLLDPGLEFHKEVLESEQEGYKYQMNLWLSELTERFAEVNKNVSSRLEFGNVTKKIGEVAYDWQADYIVIGSHDLELASRCALGSVASAVLRDAPCSMETVRSKHLRELFLKKDVVSSEEIKSIVTLPPKRILIATDLSPESECAINWVMEQQWHPSTEFRVVTVAAAAHQDIRTNWFSSGSLFIKEAQHLREIAAQLKVQAQDVAKKYGYNMVEADVITEVSPVDALVKLANEWESELVVTGARGANRHPDARAGSTCVNVLDRLHCSMIAIQNDAPRQVKFSWSKGQ